MRTGLRPTTALALVALTMAAAAAQASTPPVTPTAPEATDSSASSVSSADRTVERTRAPLPRPEVEIVQAHAPAVVVTPVAFVGKGIPANLLDAYRSAEALLARTEPGCGLRWYHLAGIGRIESGHARGGQAVANGDTAPRIMGPALTGGPFAAIPDSDNGALDGDPVWDRAVGPMQFIPTTWAVYRTDGNNDGVSTPHNIYDAAAASGRYLCSGGLNLANPSDLDAAIFRYNHSREYVSTVMGWMHLYSS
ncbi:MAG TPA: lytic transglycosylase domain-containing protein, partial [Actinokineospora sp.]|nr:lytic transglycosylase domain-containing protein [Actinokineospora sp.]